MTMKGQIKLPVTCIKFMLNTDCCVIWYNTESLIFCFLQLIYVCRGEWDCICNKWEIIIVDCVSRPVGYEKIVCSIILLQLFAVHSW